MKTLLFLVSMIVITTSKGQYSLIKIEHIGPSNVTILPLYIVKDSCNYQPMIEANPDDNLYIQYLEGKTFRMFDSLIISTGFDTMRTNKKNNWGSFKLSSSDSTNKIKYTYYLCCADEAILTFRKFSAISSGFPSPDLLLRKFSYFIVILEQGKKVKN